MRRITVVENAIIIFQIQRTATENSHDTLPGTETNILLVSREIPKIQGFPYIHL